MSILKKNKSDLPDNLHDLIKYLDKTYPNRTSQPSDNLADIMYISGQRSVIDFLKQKLNDQEV